MVFFYIITPTFERPDQLQRNMNSVTKQSYKNYKHIIVDDSVTNETWKFLKNFSKNDKQIFFRNQQNYGVNYSRNRALDFCKKDANENFDNYIIFLDDDDWFSENALTEIVSRIEKEGESWYISRLCKKDGMSLTSIKRYE